MNLAGAVPLKSSTRSLLLRKSAVHRQMPSLLRLPALSHGARCLPVAVRLRGQNDSNDGGAFHEVLCDGWCDGDLGCRGGRGSSTRVPRVLVRSTSVFRAACEFSREPWRCRRGRWMIQYEDSASPPRRRLLGEGTMEIGGSRVTVSPHVSREMLLVGSHRGAGPADARGGRWPR